MAVRQKMWPARFLQPPAGTGALWHRTVIVSVIPTINVSASIKIITIVNYIVITTIDIMNTGIRIFYWF